MTYDPDAVLAQLKGDEASRNFVYDDATGAPIAAGSRMVGNPTVGIGRNLAGRGLSDDEIEYLCRNDIAACAAELDQNVPWWRQLSPVRQGQMINLCFNMGWPKLSGFHHFLAAMQAGNWQGAVAELQNSLWWDQVGRRGPEIAEKILAG